MRTSCPHLSLSLSLSLLSQAYIGDAVWELALRSRELDTARALAGVRPRVAARARAEYQAAALRELEKSGCLSTEELYVSLSLSLFHIITPSTRISMHACVSLRERLTSIAYVVDAGRLCDGDAMHLSRFRTVFSRMGLPVLAYISPRLRWSVCSALCMSRVSMREYTY